jgi:hypothetical protein
VTFPKSQYGDESWSRWSQLTFPGVLPGPVAAGFIASLKVSRPSRSGAAKLDPVNRQLGRGVLGVTLEGKQILSHCSGGTS